MDAELPYPLPPAPEPPPPAAAPTPREPAWSGLELVVLILLTLAAIAAVTLCVALTWAIGLRMNGAAAQMPHELQVVALVLSGQTGGLLIGFLLAWLVIAHVHNARFWRAIHWRWLHTEQTLAVLAGGAVMMIVVQVLSHLLPMPSTVPMDQLFTPRTAWLLVIYGVGIAPFFEEFFFRGLIYPTLRATFSEGVTREELHAWRPLVRVMAALAAIGIAAWHWRTTVLEPGLKQGGGAGWTVALIVALVILVVPDALTATVGWAVNQLARWGRAEMLAIGLTGLLFGLMHAAQLGWAWAAVLIMVLVGVVLTAVRAATGSLTASWLFHCAYNGTLFAAQYVATRGFHNFSGLH